MATKLKQFQAFRNVSVNTLQVIFNLSKTALADPSSKLIFATWYKQVPSCKETFDANQLEIIALVADKPVQLELENEIGSQFLSKFIQIEVAYEQLFPTSTNPQSMQLNNESFSRPFVDHLQRISLPKFGGNIRDWPHFRDLFIKLVEEKPYGNIEKYHFLVGCLSGEPLDIVKAIPICADNYRIAFDTLLDRYNNERLLATLYWNEIQNIPAMTSESATCLRSLLNKIRENCEALKLLNLVDTWDFVLFNIVVSKLDPSTRKEIEIKLDKKKIPTFSEIEHLLNEHCLSLEALVASLSSEKPASFDKSASYSKVVPQVGKFNKSPSTSSSGNFRQPFAKTTLVTTASNSRHACILCAQSHALFACPVFKDKQPHERFEIAKNNRVCINCLSPGHAVSKCSSERNCRSCSSRHHSLLHFPPRLSSPIAQTATSSPQSSDQVTSCASSCSTSYSTRPPVLLGTIVLKIRDCFGNYHTARALLDTGSQTSYITTCLVNRLKLPKQANAIPISGLGNIAMNSSSTVTSEIRPIDSMSPTFEFEFFLLDKICGNLPNQSLNSDICLPRGIRLADSLWYQSRPVQLLLGADVYPFITRTSVDSAPRTRDYPFLLGTVFGQVILGPVKLGHPQQVVQSLLSVSEPPLEQIVEQFWDIEEIHSKPLVNAEEEFAESFFRKSLFRDVSGRFGVALPFKVANPTFDGSMGIADRRLRSLENRLASQPQLKALYLDFMREYLDAGHMTLLSTNPCGNDCYYISHHGVFKHGEENTKIRVVFDASAKASNQQSLNDTLLVGPKLQKDIVQLLLQFRTHPFVFTCDVRQMYRQILIRFEDRKYQLIRWRFSPEDPIATYQLNTITYGVSSAPYLAIRTLLELADIGADQFPLAVNAIRSSLYVDDLICGTSSLEEARKFVAQLVDLFALGCFELRKWASNCVDVLDSIPVEFRQVQARSFDIDPSSAIKILGLQWHSSSDTFAFIQLQQSFWSRWNNEYLHTLFQKSHWAKDKKLVPADIGVLVLLKDDTTPPLQWRLGRIERLFPGSDGIARVACVHTTRGSFKRPLVKLCALPTQ
ncbi:uncharacterized protein LOC116176128 [Photinus pyralis]|uniref:uncharacterized protein LOC116176128 n=1 Tax=Photinus pyralis TaxID=7054 RepID=UPI001267101C|nr:uncharacterized protein LOC116176128 [Photinus pyralis]